MIVERRRNRGDVENVVKEEMKKIKTMNCYNLKG